MVVVADAVGGCAASGVTDAVFDLCGVLVDWRPAHALEGLFPQQAVRDFTSMGDRCGFLYYDDVLDGGADFDQTAAAYEHERGPELARMFRAYYERIDQSLVRLMPGMGELVAELRAAGVRCWGLSNWSKRCAGAFTQRFPELGQLLDGLLVSGIEGVKKPDVAAFRLAERKFGLNPAATVFFDDNSLNADAATAAGWHGRPFIDAAHARADLARLGIALSDAAAGERVAAGSSPANGGGTPFSLTAQGGGEEGALWRGLTVADLVFPALGDPYDGRNDEAFWLARYREYRALEWDRLDWPSLQKTLAAVARRLAAHPEEAPELALEATGPDERLFLEMWFGFGDPPVAAFELPDGRFEVSYGQHRICALADFPMQEADRDLMGIGPRGFADTPPLAPETSVPVLVRSLSSH